MAKLLSKNLKIECPFCEEKRTVADWDKASLASCDNRQERKEYRTLQKRTSYSANLMFRCPVCHVWCEGATLKLQDHPELGGKKAQFFKEQDFGEEE